jgi:RNA polymerase sigma-70 factor (ECF subfamily)
MDTKRKRALNKETWVDNYGDALYHFALTQVRKKDIAEDLVQETFLSAVRSQKRFKGLSSEKTWLFSILKHKVLDYFRKRRVRPQMSGMADNSVDNYMFSAMKGDWRNPPAHWSTHPAEAHENREFLDYLYQCLSQLPKRTADVFIYREIDGLSTAEICKLLGISASNCWTMLSRARMQLRQSMGLYGFSRPMEG